MGTKNTDAEDRKEAEMEKQALEMLRDVNVTVGEWGHAEVEFPDTGRTHLVYLVTESDYQISCDLEDDPTLVDYFVELFRFYGPSYSVGARESEQSDTVAAHSPKEAVAVALAQGIRW